MSEKKHSTALVFGGGGAVGVGWQSGLLVGLGEAGVDLTTADLVVGTSAGSIVGSVFGSGADLRLAMDPITRLGHALARRDLAEDAHALMALLADPDIAESPQELVRALGEIASSGAGLSEKAHLGLFDVLAGLSWPAGLHVTGHDVVSGELEVWDRDSGVPLARAVAASCSVPPFVSPVVIDGRSYLDGGARSHLNASIVAGSERAILFASLPVVADPEGPPGMRALMRRVWDEVEGLRDGGTATLVVEPSQEVLELSANAVGMIDPALVQPAHALGRAQAGRERDRIKDFWSSVDGG